MWSPWAEALIAKYAPILIGLLFGTSAKYGLALIDGQKVTMRTVAIDALVIGMVAIAAANVVDRAGASGNTAALVAALFAVSSDRAMRLLREWFLRRLDSALARAGSGRSTDI